MSDLGQRIKKLREAKGLTMKSVAQAIEVPVATYKEWEYGRSIQGVTPYLKLADFFEVSLRELLTGQPRSQALHLISKIDQVEITLKELKKELISL